MRQSRSTIYLLLCSILCATRVTCDRFTCRGLRSCTLENYDGDIDSELAEYQQKDVVGSLKVTNLSIAIDHVPAEIFRELPNLVILDMSACNVAQIRPATFNAATNLIGLNLSHNRLTILNGDEFNGATNVTEINLSSNCIRTIDGNTFRHLAKLTKIDVSHNRLTRTDSMHDAFANLHGLTDLAIANNSLTSLAFLRDLTNLTRLTLSYNRLRFIPIADADIFARLINLKDLFLKSVDLYEVFESYAPYIFNGELRVLDIADNNLNGLDIRYLMRLENLVEFHGAGNQFIHTQSFHDSINLAMPQLRVIDISDNNWQCADLRALLKRIKQRNIAVPSKMDRWVPNIERIPCTGLLYENVTPCPNTQNSVAPVDKVIEKRFNQLYLDLNGIALEHNQRLIDTNAQIMTILTLVKVLFVICITNTVCLIIFGCRVIRKRRAAAQRVSQMDERDKLLQ